MEKAPCSSKYSLPPAYGWLKSHLSHNLHLPPPLAWARAKACLSEDTAIQFKSNNLVHGQPHSTQYQAIEDYMSNDKAKELNAKISDTITALCAETDAAAQSETFRKYLTTFSRFYKYSFGNTLLIACQAPEATQVAGFHTWRKCGRWVKKGATGIRILAPVIYKREAKNEEAEKDSTRVFFRTVTVFDLAMTEGDPLPELNTNATEGGEALLPLLEDAAAKLNIQLIYKAIPGGAEGLSKGGVILIEESLDTPARCGVILHELAHELKHKGPQREGTTKQQRELEAESVAYTVLAHYGIHADSRFYLAMYGITAEMLTASLQTIASTAKQIIGLLDNNSAEEDGEGEDISAPQLTPEYSNAA
jgi:N-terminal domain of anti-restriction factor ArdC